MGMEVCPKCKEEAVVERSSYKLCHHCDTVFKTEWRNKIETALEKELGADLLAAYKVGDEAVVQWVRTRRGEKEYGVHTAILHEGDADLLWGFYVYEDNEGASRSLENYLDRKERLVK